MKAMIFAAGFGRRLQPLTLDKPKALIEVKNRPMLDWVIRHLMRFGVREIIINTHYLHPQIVSYLNIHRYGISISLSHEPEILGTGGGFYRTRDFWGNDDFLLYNVDILCNADLESFLQHHRHGGAEVTLGVNRRLSGSMLLVDERGALVGRRRNEREELLREPVGKVTPVGFCGLHAVSPRLLGWIKPPIEFSIIDLYYRLLEAGLSVLTWDIGNAYWEDIGTPEALVGAEASFPG